MFQACLFQTDINILMTIVPNEGHPHRPLVYLPRYPLRLRLFRLRLRPPPLRGLFEEHQLRQADLCMMVVLGAKQRSEAEFRALLKEADDRLEITNVRENPLGVGVLEVRLIEG